MTNCHPAEEDKAASSPDGEVAADSSPRWLLWIHGSLDLLCACLLFGIFVIGAGDFIGERSHRMLVVATNWRQGHGLVFNEFDPIFGVGSPLWALLIGLFSYPLMSVTLSAKVLSWLGVLGLIGGFFLLFNHMRRGAGFLALALLAIMVDDQKILNQFGQESLLAMALGIWALWMHLTQRWPVTQGLLLSLMILLRFDFSILVLLIAVAKIPRRGIHIGGIIAFLCPIGLWLLFAATLYPQSDHLARVSAALTAPPMSLLDWLSRPSQPQLAGLFGDHYHWIWHRHGLLWMGSLGLAASLVTRHRAARVVFLWALLYLMLYSFARAECYESVYTPALVFLKFGSILWVLYFMTWANRRWLDTGLRLGLLALVVTLIIPPSSGEPSDTADEENAGETTSQIDEQREITRIHREIAEVLSDRLESGDSVAVFGAGVIRFHSDLRVIDLNQVALQGSGEDVAEALETFAGALPNHAVVTEEQMEDFPALKSLLEERYIFLISHESHFIFQIDRHGLARMSASEILTLRDQALADDDVDLLQAIAFRFLSMGRRGEALDTMTTLFERHPPNDHEAARLLSLIASLPTDQMRIAWIRGLLPLLDQLRDPAALAQLSDVCYRRGLHDEARLLIERAVDIDPTHAGYHFALGRALTRLGEYEQAETNLRYAADEGDEGLRLWTLRSLALLYERQRRSEAAIECWESLLDCSIESLRSEAEQALRRLGSSIPN